MILYAFNIPETREELATWLEQSITGVHLRELVAELKAVHGDGDREKLESFVGEHDLQQVLDQGLSKLSNEQLQKLLTNPSSLFELQDKIAIDGSNHWRDVAQEVDHKIGNFSEILDQVLNAENTSTASPVSPAAASSASPWYAHPFFVAVTTAAAVLIAVNLQKQPDPKPVDPPTVVAQVKTGWGWDRPGALKEDLGGAEYLDGLADAANEWFNKRPETAKELAVRIAQFRQGCSTLILASHKPLAEADRTWLVEKCQAWAAKLDAHLVAVESGQSTSEVRDAADETIRKLMTAMQNKAKEISA